jgi:hypothetical protein
MISLSGISPAEGEKLVALDSPVEFTLVDGGDGIDISTLIVELRGFRAVEGMTFKNGFDGPASLITPSGNDFMVSIDPESNFLVGNVYDVKIQVKDFNDKFFNHTYSFKTIPEEPILVTSSPAENDILTSPQLIYLEFEDIIDGVDEASITVSINGLNYIVGGIAESEPNGLLTDVATEGTTAFVRIDPIEALRNGIYEIEYSVADTLGNYLRSSMNFSINQQTEILPSTFPDTGFSGYFQGIERVSDVGCGDSLYIQWNEPVKKFYRNELFVVVYQDPFRLNVFDNPKYLAAVGVEDATVTGLKAGESLSFAARALEVGSGVFDLNGMVEADEGFYHIPDATGIVSIVESTDSSIQVESTDGFPDAGLIFIGREAIRYNSINRVTNTFIIPPNGRGVLGSTPGIYLVGDTVELFLLCSDSNTVIVMSTPTFQDGYDFDRYINGTGLVVTDYSDNDRVFNQGFDFCGWHDDRPDQVLSGKNNSDCGSYQGGEHNGWRGMDLYDRMLNREEVLLEVTGEPVILLKRIWDGVTCTCMGSRKMSPKMRTCQECYGTGYVGGFQQFNNLRREDRRIMVSFDEAAEDLFLGEKEHFQQEFEPNAWTLPQPAIRDRDLILRFDFTEDLEFLYEVLNVSREKIFNRRFGRQRVALKRIDKTKIYNTFPFDLSRIPTTP